MKDVVLLALSPYLLKQNLVRLTRQSDDVLPMAIRAGESGARRLPPIRKAQGSPETSGRTWPTLDEVAELDAAI